MDHLVVKVFIIGLGIFMSLALFAPIVQVTDPNGYSLTVEDPVSGLPIYKPNTSFSVLSGCFENTADINNLGFHGAPVTVQKSADTFRIVVIGSSYVEARQVPVSQLFSTLLQEKLNTDPAAEFTYEVIPLGVNGNTTLLNTLYYKYYGAPLKPDLVIDIESAFELLHKPDTPAFDAEGNVVLEVPQKHESAAAASVRVLLRHSKLLVNLYNRALVFKEASSSFFEKPFFFLSPASDAVSATDTAQAERTRWVQKEKLVGALQEQVEKGGARFVFASWVGPEEAASTREEMSRHMQEMALRRGFTYYDLVPFVEAQQDVQGERATFLPCDGHWSPAGHRYIADALTVYLFEHPALLSR